MRYNRTNFVSARVVMGLIQAMQAILASGLPVYLEDRKGQRWLRVALKMIEGRPTYEFIARNGQEVGDVILQASFDWHEEDLKEFSALLVKVYTMTELPAIKPRPTAPEEGIIDPKELGATHYMEHPQGHLVFGYFKYSWLGLKRRFQVVANWCKNDTIRKHDFEMTPETFNFYKMGGRLV
ncbi:membrane protein [Pseudomonas phage PlaquesPlease]|uniref:Membrane protein n=1 Tax=Pseudomonas phage PlaquesPlease TaxID=2762289 RepID=A0A7G8LJR8_9CAUD|nr:membrane protein [Pseudomonas phage PlaquesPlease]